MQPEVKWVPWRCTCGYAAGRYDTVCSACGAARPEGAEVKTSNERPTGGSVHDPAVCDRSPSNQEIEAAFQSGNATVFCRKCGQPYPDTVMVGPAIIRITKDVHTIRTASIVWMVLTFTGIGLGLLLWLMK